MKKASMFGLLAVLGAGCAHQQVVEPQAGTVTEAPPPAQVKPPPQVEVSAAPAQDGVPELEKALRNATAYFDFNGDRLNDEGMNALQRVGEVLRKHPSLQVRIDGNCDERGTEEYNLALGQRRAEVARKYLVALGVKPPQVDTSSHGAEVPADPRHTADAWAKNRRAEVQRASN